MDQPLEKMGVSKKLSDKIAKQYEVYKTGPLAIFEPNCHNNHAKGEWEADESKGEQRSMLYSEYGDEVGSSSGRSFEDQSRRSLMIQPFSVTFERKDGGRNPRGYLKGNNYQNFQGGAGPGDPGYIPPKFPYPGQLGPPGTRIMNPNDLAFNFSLKDMFSSFLGIFIDQKFELTEVLTGCETRNTYYVYEMSAQQRRKGKPILRCKEYSDWCARNCTLGSCRPMSIKCFNLWNHDEMCLEFERPCTCTFLCFDRPVLKVYHTEGGQKRYIGKVVDNCDCLNFTFDVRDANNDLVFYVKGECCQLGFWCRCPCKGCRKIYFDISSKKNGVPFQGRLIRHGKRSCAKRLVGDADDFSVPFPPGSSFDMRCLMLAVTLLIDYMIFDQNPSDQRRQRQNFL